MSTRREPGSRASPKRIAVLISGRGSNMEALLDAGLPVATVISNVPGARGLDIARARGLAVSVVDHRDHPDRATFDTKIAEELDKHRPDLVVLAGFMRVLSSAFVERYTGRLLNIHPSLLPAFPGRDTHRRALEGGVRIHGCTVHFVSPALDGGPIVAQAAVPVLAGDTEESLAARVLQEEHRVYPRAVAWFCEGRLSLTSDGAVCLEGESRATGVLISPPLGP